MPPGMSRRSWLGGVAALAQAKRTHADGPGNARNEAADEAAVRARAKAAGLKPGDLRSTRSDHYLAVGNAPAAFQEEALGLCEALAETFRTKFEARGFTLAPWGSRLTLVILADRASYEAFKGEEAGPAEGGHYDVSAGRLVIHDFRNAGAGEPGGRAADQTRINTFTLVHEAVHQLTFGAGLLSPGADVPVAVSEGLATFGETWTYRRPRTPFGQVNRLRLQVLTDPSSGGWIDLEELLTRDGLFNDAPTEQQAYAEAWVLVYEHMKNNQRAARLRTYLDRLRTRRDGKDRAADAKATLGDLRRLDRDLKKAARLML